MVYEIPPFEGIGGLLIMTTIFTFKKAIAIKRIRSKMNVVNGGLKRSYQSWEFVRLTVSSHIIAPGTSRAYAKVDKPITVENSVGNSIFSEAMIKALQKNRVNGY